MKRVLLSLGWVVGAFLVVRAIVEPFVIDFGDKSSYEKDWGGPNIVGVLLVHCGPGIIAAVLMARSVLRRRQGEPA